MANMSIVVPAYNAEKYIKKTLDSLKNQSMQEIEIICVNDGSKDNTLRIMKEYAASDSRFIIIDKKNEGIAFARRDGIKKSSSKYISFLDSDDFYEKNFCEKMYILMEKNNLDLAECGYNLIFENNTVKEHYFLEKNFIFEKKDFIENIFNTTIINGKEGVVVWNKVYKKSIIDKAVKDYGKNVLEDYIFNLQYYSMVDRYQFIHETLLNYRVRSNSLSKKFDRNFFEALKNVQNVKEKIMIQMNFETEKYSQAAKWYCNYTKNYLLANSIYFKDINLFNQVVNDSILENQIKRCEKKDWFYTVINKNKFLITLSMCGYEIIRYGRKVIISCIRGRGI